MAKKGQLAYWRSQNWVKSDGTPCGDSQAQKNPARCKPKSEWRNMTASQKQSDNALKKRGGTQGKQFVPAKGSAKVESKGRPQQSAGKICPEGKAWAMKKYGKWSAYAAMGASKYCKKK